MTEKHAALCSG